jgi:hypothetical protein
MGALNRDFWKMIKETDPVSGRTVFRIQPRTLVLIYAVIAMLEALGAIGLMASIPADTKNSLLLGFSPQRIMLIGMLFLGLLAFAVLGWASWRSPAWAAHFIAKLTQPRVKNWLLGILTLLFLVGWVSSFLPSYRLFPNDAYFERLKPIFYWLTLVLAETLVALILTGYGVYPAEPNNRWAQRRRLLSSIGITAAVFALIWCGMLVTRIGIAPDDRFWNEAGVPILGLQALLAWAASLIIGALLFTRASTQAAGVRTPFLSGLKLDLLICALLWGAAALFWTQTPMPRSYFAPGPYAPNNVYYPYSDALVYDRGAQLALVGQGLNNNEYFEKPFYLLFLTLLHAAAGQTYSAVTQLQTICLALFPVLLYLTGKLLYNRTAGLLAGAFTIIQQTNAIAATLQIQVSTPRLIMTEFPTAFGVALLSLVLVWWLKRRPSAPLYALLAGGILGTLVLTRTAALLLVPFVLAAFLVVFWKHWRRLLNACGLLILALVLVVAPWFVTNRAVDGRSFIEEKVLAVFESRYTASDASTDDTGAQASALNPVTVPTPANTTPLPTTAITAPPATPAAPTQAPPGTARPPAPTVAAITPPSPDGGLAGRAQQALQFTPGHFFHNLSMSALILPLSLRFDDLQHTLSAPYWTIKWNGSLPLDQVLLLALNLLVVAVGISAAWQYGKLAGFIPLILLIAYYLSNALGRTSGSRYLVPVDWVALLYFALGLIQLSAWGAAFLGYRLEGPNADAASIPGSTDRSQTLRSGVLLCAGLLFLGLSPLLIGKVFPQRYTTTDPQTLLAQTLSRGSLQQAGVNPQDVTHLLANPYSVIARGRLLYPRYYYPEQGEPPSKFWPSFGVHNYGRLIFQLVGPRSQLVVLPMESPSPRIPDAADITVIGCGTQEDIQAQAVIIEGSPDVVYLRSPSSGWQCPLPEPVCNNNHQCH